MKKILIIAAGVLCSAAIYLGINAYSNNSQTSLIAQNIEALTQGEGLPGDIIQRNCNWQQNQYCDIYYNGYIWSNSNMIKK